MNTRNLYIVLIAGVLGILLVVQSKSFEDVAASLLRDKQSNVFQEIQILKNKNEDLSSEILDLEKTIDQLTNQDQALSAIEEEIDKYKKLSGKFSIFGPGMVLSLDAEITATLMIDLVNEFFNAGAEAVQINGVRVVNHTAGFDTLPQGQILLNGGILSAPYTFNALGESSSIIDVLELPGGLIDRIEAIYPDLVIVTQQMDVIQML